VRAHLGLSGIADHQGRYRDARTHAARTLAMNNLGWCHARLGEYQQALDYCRQAISLQRQVGDRYCEALAWDSLGCTHYRLGRHAEASSTSNTATTPRKSGPK
jgi:tetratricopeptide (TPR) repeat protein